LAQLGLGAWLDLSLLNVPNRTLATPGLRATPRASRRLTPTSKSVDSGNWNWRAAPGRETAPGFFVLTVSDAVLVQRS